MNDITAVLPYVKLRFNIEHPTLEECYLYGYECALAEVDESDNPFAEFSIDAKYWHDGWWAGFAEEEPIFDFTNQVDKHENLSNTQLLAAANDGVFFNGAKTLFSRVLKITGVIVASAIVGYQVFELVA
ncbi:MAG: hypothetical protein A3E88_04340 [Legionellales bacterium RIFCSPHIGHO2_12_FULL_35_11]|nr:MAG: hypothetical protein A3E88_04340 [Legionellales bacterium RIFCSPHIGHO2_12_FULL_35_11]